MAHTLFRFNGHTVTFSLQFQFVAISTLKWRFCYLLCFFFSSLFHSINIILWPTHAHRLQFYLLSPENKSQKFFFFRFFFINCEIMEFFNLNENKKISIDLMRLNCLWMKWLYQINLVEFACLTHVYDVGELMGWIFKW